MSSGPVEQAVAQNIPPAVLVAVIVLMFSVVVILLALIWRVFAHRFDKMESTLELVKSSLPTLATKSDLEALREQTRAGMRSMGDGFDARLQKVSDRVAVVENDLGKEIAVRQALGKP
jgi:hypothetical protein